MRLRHIGIVCEDIETSLDFYGRYFGCKIARQMDEKGTFISTLLGIEGVEVQTFKLQLPQSDGQIELLKFIRPEATPPTQSLTHLGLTHFAIQVEDIDSLYRLMSSEKIFFVAPPHLSEDKKAKVCFCRDPNGVYIEMVQLL